MYEKLTSLTRYVEYLRNLFLYVPIELDYLNRKKNMTKLELEINALLKGYPKNHNYFVVNGKLIPSFRLFNRISKVSKLYSRPLSTFLDIGCCRGFYVLDAVLNRKCSKAVGIDVFSDFINIAVSVKDYLQCVNASFFIFSLNELAASPEKFGGPFDTVLCIGTYHYMYWGSMRSPLAYMQHRTIIEQLHRVCRKRIVLSARFEIERLPDWLRRKALQSSRKKEYSLSSFIKEARRFFKVSKIGTLDKDPLLILEK